MLTRLYVDNYKSLVNFELKLDQPLTVLIGGAGTGKSAVLEVLDGLGKLFRGVPTKEVFAPESRTKFQSRDVQRIEVSVRLPKGQCHYELEIKHEEGGAQVLRESFRRDGGRGTDAVLRPDGYEIQGSPAAPDAPAGLRALRLNTSPFFALWLSQGGQPNQTSMGAFIDLISHSINVAPVAPIMKQVSTGPEQDVPDRNMAQIGGWLRRQTSDMGFSGELMRHLKERIPGLDKLKVEMLTKDLFKVDAAFVQDGAKFTLSLDELSDGQRQLIALYALFVAAKEQKRLLILDEPENYLALAEIQPWLRALEQELEDEGGQVILSSHSHTTLNLLAKGHGILLSRKNGLTTAAPFPAGELTPAQMVELGIDGT
jgi:predicted ATPase